MCNGRLSNSGNAVQRGAFIWYTKCVMKDTSIVEEKLSRLFSVKKPFSEHLAKWEDDLLPGKYDHNYFEYSGQPTKEEFEAFELEAGVTVTMVLTDQNAEWKTNDSLSFRTPSVAELEAIELKHYGSVYGESFTVRNVRRLYEKLEYHGAYLDDKLVGSCYSFSADGMTCIDGLLVDDEYRKQYVGTSLLAHIQKLYPGTTLFLHADIDDTPKDMYLKMGFEITDYVYEYSCTDLSTVEYIEM